MEPVETLSHCQQTINEPFSRKIEEHFQGQHEQARNADQQQSEMIFELNNHPDIDRTDQLDLKNDQKLEYIIHVPNRYNTNYIDYQRNSRSVNQNSSSTADNANISEKQKERLISPIVDLNDKISFSKSFENDPTYEVVTKLNEIRVKRQESQQENLWNR